LYPLVGKRLQIYN